MNDLLKLDEEIFRLINQKTSFKIFDDLMILLSSEVLFFVALFCLLIFSFYKKITILKIWSLCGIIAMGISDSVCFRILKPTFERLRPCYSMDNVRLVAASCGGYFSFPSNHAANAMAFAGVSFFILEKRVQYLLILALAFSIGLSRIYLGVHYPFDVLAGFFTGMLIGLLTGFVAKRLLKKNFDKKTR